MKKKELIKTLEHGIGILQEENQRLISDNRKLENQTNKSINEAIQLIQIQFAQEKARNYYSTKVLNKRAILCAENYTPIPPDDSRTVIFQPFFDGDLIPLTVDWAGLNIENCVLTETYVVNNYLLDDSKSSKITRDVARENAIFRPVKLSPGMLLKVTFKNVGKEAAVIMPFAICERLPPETKDDVIAITR